jgi:hypothetical protein
MSGGNFRVKISYPLKRCDVFHDPNVSCGNRSRMHRINSKDKKRIGIIYFIEGIYDVAKGK